MEFTEYKERETVVPEVNKILSKWDEVVAGLDKKLKDIANKF